MHHHNHRHLPDIVLILKKNPTTQSIFNLQKSFENGFNNFATVRGDPDLDPVKDQADYKKLMNAYDAKGFNPFGFLGSKQ